MAWFESWVDIEDTRPEYTVGDVLHLHWDEYRARYGATPEQVKAALAMMACRTAVLGGHVKICPDCGYIEFSLPGGRQASIRARIGIVRRVGRSSGRSGWRRASCWRCRSSIFTPYLR